MQEIQELIVARFSKLADEGKITELVDKQVENLVKEMLEKSLRGYSDFSKALEKKFEQAMVARIDEMGFTQYADTIVKAITRKLENGVIEVTNGVIDKNLDKFVEDLLESPPEKVKLSDIVEKFLEQVKESKLEDCSCDYSGEIGFKVVEDTDRITSSSWRWFTIYLKEDGEVTSKTSTYSSTPSYDYDLKLRVHQPKDSDLATLAGISFKYGSTVEEDFFVRENHGFEKLLLNMYCRGTRIEMDEDDCETTWERDE